MVRGYSYLYGFEYSILRLAWILDESDILRIFEFETWEQNMINKEESEMFERLCANGKALFVPAYENGSARIDHIVDAQDAAQAVFLCIENKASRGEIFNIAGPCPFKYDEFIEYVSKKSGKKWHKGKTSGAFPYELSIEKAKKIISYKPVFGIKEILKKAFK